MQMCEIVKFQNVHPVLQTDIITAVVKCAMISLASLLPFSKFRPGEQCQYRSGPVILSFLAL